MNHWQIRFFSLLAAIVLWVGQADCQAKYAYAIRYGTISLAGIVYSTAHLDQFDLKDDSLISSIPINSTYNSATILDNDRIILCSTQDTKHGPGGADIYSLKQKKIIDSFKLSGAYPKMAAIVNDKICITTGKKIEGFDRLICWPAIEIFDRVTLSKIADLNFRRDERIEESISIDPITNKLYFLGWNTAWEPFFDGGLIGEIDIKTTKVVKQIEAGWNFGGGSGIEIAVNNLYCSAIYPSSGEGYKNEADRRLNNRLFVFDPVNFKIIKTINISILATQLKYVPEVNHLFIAHASWSEKTPQYIEILDCTTDNIIARISMKGIRRMAYVGNHKLYVSNSGGPNFGSNGRGNIAVIDVRTNKIIKRIPGEYAPIAYNFEAK
ncbi:hypothetical protein A2311_03070 [candidate division WOR-1 bacterium RIFOXYB2_FULL_48_7]|uniref:Methanethiol oxidase n=1 Tax=candidate division WOR-1 bacterium RIFOXYB2_FULL_48_7 TaxID=1802583 RepID=A0A1F4TUQ1_UNCSA|nr:MAG: hypothetical protein A2311_03070 [candidate division WOR-1 bacterium RIFOXYB2_FULL_48_7]